MLLHTDEILGVLLLSHFCCCLIAGNKPWSGLLRHPNTGPSKATEAMQGQTLFSTYVLLGEKQTMNPGSDDMANKTMVCFLGLQQESAYHFSSVHQETACSHETKVDFNYGLMWCVNYVTVTNEAKNWGGKKGVATRTYLTDKDETGRKKIITLR